jgi:hypothetical protein
MSSSQELISIKEFQRRVWGEKSTQFPKGGVLLEFCRNFAGARNKKIQSPLSDWIF